MEHPVKSVPETHTVPYASLTSHNVHDLRLHLAAVFSPSSNHMVSINVTTNVVNRGRQEIERIERARERERERERDVGHTYGFVISRKKVLCYGR